jgi:hypothetical protein
VTQADLTQARGDRIAEAIKDYLSRHPDAADSAEGIAKWWLPGLDARATVADVEQQLEHLHRLGLVDKQILPDGRALYRAPRLATD